MSIIVNSKRSMIKTRKRTRKVEEQPVEEIQEEQIEEEPPAPSDLQKLVSKANKAESDEDEEEEGEEAPKKIFSDKFILVCDNIEPFRIKAIELPKIIFSQHRDNQTIREKSSIMVAVYTVPRDDYPFKRILEACKKEKIKFTIKWLDDKGVIKSEWVFGGARIQGVDFGSAAYERPELSEAAMEIGYQTINIDGVEF
jgi:hypothetical protein